MAKKKKSNLFGLLTGLSVLLAIVSVVMIFLPAIAMKDADETFNGLKIVFGYEKETLISDVTYFEFSFMNLLTYLLVILGGVLSAMNAVKKPSKLLTLLSAAAFLLAGIFFFSAVGLTAYDDDISKVVSAFGGDIKNGFKLGIGSVIGGISSLLAAGCSAVAFLSKK